MAELSGMTEGEAYQSQKPRMEKVFTNMHLRRNLPENPWLFPNLGMVVGLAIGSKFSKSYNDPNFGTHFLLSALNWSRKSIALFPGVI